MQAIPTRFAWLLAACALALGLVPASSRAAEIAGNADVATWTCTNAPCPWGPQVSGYATGWPESMSPTSSRFGYTVNRAVYLPAAQANGLTITVQYGTATFYAGRPDADSHRALATVGEGGSHRVEGLADGEVLSAQSAAPFGYAFAVAETVPDGSVSSQAITWLCTGSPCPWGSPLGGQSAVWPQSAAPSQQRLGYTASAGIYLPATYANGMSVQVKSGTASLYAGHPNDESHRLLATLTAGSSTFQVSGLQAGEVLSLAGSQAFTYAVERADPAAPGNPTDPTPPPAGNTNQSSLIVQWHCTGAPCPWGSPLEGQALVWPSELAATNTRLGYATSANVYLPAEAAGTVSIKLLSGSASAYAGYPSGDSHRLLGAVTAGQTLTFGGLSTGEVVSVQGSETFTYEITVGTLPPPPAEEGTVVNSVPAFWRCNSPDCSGSDWSSAVINWPASAAYENNGRTGNNSRTVYSAAGELLYPYMGAWANGCEVTAVSGVVMIIEWQRGTDTWRETWLNPGQTHVIQLSGTENGAMIETFDGWAPSFSVRLKNCAPQQIR